MILPLRKPWIRILLGLSAGYAALWMFDLGARKLVLVAPGLRQPEDHVIPDGSTYRVARETVWYTVMRHAVIPASTLVALLTCVFLGRERRPDGETHCRRCDHILRGISSPRCSECGEQI